MAFKEILSKIRSIVLCGGKDENRPSLEIGSPTDVRHLNIEESMPHLPQEAIKTIRERSSHDATRLLSLQSHPPAQSCSINPSNSHSPPTTASPFRSPSLVLLNNASINLPTALPTPPRRQHSDASSPSFRMKGMQVWERTCRLSASIGSYYGEHRELDIRKGSEDEEALVLDLGYDSGMELDIELKECEIDSPISGKSALSLGGFEVQDTVGGGAKDDARCNNGAKSNTKEVFSDNAGDGNSSNSQEDSATTVALAEIQPLVKA